MGEPSLPKATTPAKKKKGSAWAQGKPRTLLEFVHLRDWSNVKYIKDLELTDLEVHMILTSADVAPRTAGSLNARDRRDADEMLKDMPVKHRYEAYAIYMNQVSAKTLLVWDSPAMRRWTDEAYTLARAVNPVHFAFEKGYVMAADYEPVLQRDASSLEAFTDLFLYLMLVKGSGYVMKTYRPNAKALLPKPKTVKIGARPIAASAIKKGMKIDPTKVRVYRGGKEFELTPNQIRWANKPGKIIKTTHGASLNTDPGATIMQKLGAYRVQTIPKELMIIQRGPKNITHFEIVPSTTALEKLQCSGW